MAAPPESLATPGHIPRRSIDLMDILILAIVLNKQRDLHEKDLLKEPE